LRENVVPARCRTGAGEVGKERNACNASVEIAGSKTVVKFESVDVVESACSTIVGAAGRVDVGREEQLDSVDGVEVDVVQVEDLVELDALVVDGRQRAVTDFSEEGDALQTCLAGGKGDAG
jgi:hypothetical protein